MNIDAFAHVCLTCLITAVDTEVRLLASFHTKQLLQLLAMLRKKKGAADSVLLFRHHI